MVWDSFYWSIICILYTHNVAVLKATRGLLACSCQGELHGSALAFFSPDCLQVPAVLVCLRCPFVICLSLWQSSWGDQLEGGRKDLLSQCPFGFDIWRVLVRPWEHVVTGRKKREGKGLQTNTLLKDSSQNSINSTPVPCFYHFLLAH